MEQASFLTGGVLYDRLQKVRANFYDKIDENIHAATYDRVERDEAYAEPEFTGKFMDICARYFERDGDGRALAKGMTVVESIQKNIREDGYLGMLGAGNELRKFSVWNHAFTLYGLTRMYDVTGDPAIKDLVIRAADWVYNAYAGENPPDILEASNKGSQNITCFFAMLRAYEVTGERKYLDFVGKTIAYCESTDMNLLSFESILSLRSRKGIEMLVVYLGVLKYGLLAGEGRAVDAAKRYFDEVAATQIRNTGNGTIREDWTENGNAPRLMPTEEKPNETCVAVGIIELAISLFYTFPEPKYLDVIEKTLFNHICGSLEKGGSDLAYYQGNYGKKIYRTDGGAYQCCRYRGFTLFSYLETMLYRFEGDTLTPILYAASEFACDGVTCKQITDFPASGDITFEINANRPITLRMRVPVWCETYALAVDGEEITLLPEGQYLSVSLAAGAHTVSLTLTEALTVHRHEIDGKPYLSATYGPLLLAQDTHYGGDLWQPLSADAPFARTAPNGEAIVKLTAGDRTLVDFASAGGNAPEKDTYTVFIPQK
ncbi:MAG: glycoside hydrolase family 127 protein [Clostridia bacterium]|nr:glycoside hydrolase family 127 protein [Clostridia bacterium]